MRCNTQRPPSPKWQHVRRPPSPRNDRALPLALLEAPHIINRNPPAAIGRDTVECAHMALVKLAFQVAHNRSVGGITIRPVGTLDGQNMEEVVLRQAFSHCSPGRTAAVALTVERHALELRAPIGVGDRGDVDGRREREWGVHEAQREGQEKGEGEVETEGQGRARGAEDGDERSGRGWGGGVVEEVALKGGEGARVGHVRDEELNDCGWV